MKEGENILRILKETKQALKREDVIKLKQLSNQTIHAVSVYQDTDNIAVAVIVYSLGKIIERGNYKSLPGWKKFYNNSVLSLDNTISAIKKKDEIKFKEGITSLRDIVNKFSGKFKIYIQEVFRKASINKASRIYEHGISMEQTAKMLGITMFELANYAGQTGISDVPESKTLGVKSRIKLAMEMFG